MTRYSIPVDLFNPGQVFGCLGFMELAAVLLGPVSARFDWNGKTGVRFELSTAGSSDPFENALGFLSRAQVKILLPHAADIAVKWGLDSTFTSQGDPFPQPKPATPAALPAVLDDGTHRVVLDSWGDVTVRDNVKFWAGSGGYPGAALVRDSLELARDCIEGAREDPFALAAVQSSSLRFDWRRDYVPIGVGFSLNNHTNKHPKITPLGYPLVEILAVIGLSYARPLRPDPRDKLVYRYGVVVDTVLPAELHRAALGCAPLSFRTRRFRMNLAWPGQENQARCITSVSEETNL